MGNTCRRDMPIQKDKPLPRQVWNPFWSLREGILKDGECKTTSGFAYRNSLPFNGFCLLLSRICKSIQKEGAPQAICIEGTKTLQAIILLKCCSKLSAHMYHFFVCPKKRYAKKGHLKGGVSIPLPLRIPSLNDQRGWSLFGISQLAYHKMPINRFILQLGQIHEFLTNNPSPYDECLNFSQNLNFVVGCNAHIAPLE